MTSPDPGRTSRLPEHFGRAALGVALAALALAVFGLLARLLGLALLGRGSLQVALGGSIAGVTLAAVALLASRGADARIAHSGVRRRATAAAGLCVALMLGLLALPFFRFGFVPVAEAEAPHVASGPPATAVVAAEEAQGFARPIAVDAPPEQAFEAALATAEALGWSPTGTDVASQRFEARDAEGEAGATPLRVRVEETAGGSVVILSPREEGGRIAPARVRAFSERLRATVAADS
jgi:hypothetical protein